MSLTKEQHIEILTDFIKSDEFRRSRKDELEVEGLSEVCYLLQHERFPEVIRKHLNPILGLVLRKEYPETTFEIDYNSTYVFIIMTGGNFYQVIDFVTYGRF